MPGDITELLVRARTGDPDSVSRLFEAIYAELKRIARKQLRNERRDHTLQPSALVHEAFVRLTPANLHSENRAQLFGTAASVMRHILVDHARAHRAQKRMGRLQRVELDHLPVMFSNDDAERLFVIDELLRQLEPLDPRVVKVIELRFFAGLTVDEAAAALDISPKTVKRDWEFGRDWMAARLHESA
jgi:RNA polymerase sigma-70 factor, ECF subfamily